jgi:predicted transcriptional regulator
VLDEQLDPILPKEQVIEKVRVLMGELHITGVELAKAIGITPTGVSKVFAEDRDLSYEEVQRMINYVVGRSSVIPADEGVRKYATTFEKLNWATDDEPLREVAERMFRNGFSQLPVRSASGDFRGIVSEGTVLKRILHPEVSGRKFSSLDELGSLKLRDVGVIEEPPRYPANSKMMEISQVLSNYYAVLLTSGEHVVGIITRADILKLFALTH